MKDVFITIIIIWALYRIFGQTRVFYHTNRTPQHPHPPYENYKREGEVKIERNTKDQKDIDAEDTDYEEIK